MSEVFELKGYLTYWDNMPSWNGRIEVDFDSLPPVPKSLLDWCEDNNEQPQLELVTTSEGGSVGRLQLVTRHESEGNIEVTITARWV